MSEEAKSLLPAWIGVVTAPVVWLLQLEAKFALVEWACPNHDWIIHVVSLLSLAIAAAAGLAAWRAWRGPDPETPGTRYLGILGVALSAGFFLVILVQEIPSWFLTPCQ